MGGGGVKQLDSTCAAPHRGVQLQRAVRVALAQQPRRLGQRRRQRLHLRELLGELLVPGAADRRLLQRLVRTRHVAQLAQRLGVAAKKVDPFVSESKV
jgi:hypothetical protein